MFDTLDLRKSVARWPGDDTPVEKNRYAFLCQLMSTSESLHISYQNMYLPKDQELFPSSVVNDLLNFLKKAVNDPSVEILPEDKMSIDEKRSLGELYTERELRNKKTVEQFNDGSAVRNFLQGVPDKDLDASKKLPERVNTYAFRKFLEEPFQYQASQKMYLEEEENEEKISMEPVEWNRLESSSALKFFVAQELGIPQEKKSVVDKETLRLDGDLPLGKFGENTWNDLQNDAKAFAERILAECPAEEWKFSSENFEVNIPWNEQTSWTLLANAKIVAKNALGDVKLFEVTNGSASVEKALSNYMVALGMIAKGLVAEGTSVELRILDGDLKFLVTRTQSGAVELLNALYKKMFVEGYRKVVPIKLLTETVKNVYDLNNRVLGQKGAWEYFAGRHVFDVRTQDVSGFNDKDPKKFAEEWTAAVNEMKSLMPDLAEAFQGKETKNETAAE